MVWLILALAAFWIYRKIIAPDGGSPTSPVLGRDKRSPSSTPTQVPGEERDVYRSTSGFLQVGFNFVPIDGAYRIYFTTPINYGGRRDDFFITHRLEDDRGKYICWTGAINSIADAKRVASAWTEATDIYIRTGQQFGR